VLDIDSTIKPLYGHQEGAMVGYNPHKPGRPSHCYHTYLMANLRPVLGVDVQPGDKHTPKHGQAGLWSLLRRLGRSRWPALLRGDVAWGVEPVMSRAEQQGLAYLFRLRMTANVKRALTKMTSERDWSNAGHGWQGKATMLRLVGWSRQRRVVLLRRKLDRPLVLVDRTEPDQPLLSFAEIGPDREAWEYAALVTEDQRNAAREQPVRREAAPAPLVLQFVERVLAIASVTVQLTQCDDLMIQRRNW
jgi:Transposase DDE domain group 1